MKVTIKHSRSEDSYNYTWSQVEVLVDGEHVGGGSFGGEPEDNMECRDYRWVRPLIRALASKLGADVESVEVREESE